MKTEKINDKESYWDVVLFAVLQTIVFAVYGGVQARALSGAIVGVIIGTVILFLMALITTTLKRLAKRVDTYNLGDQLPSVARDFLRKNPEFRASLGQGVMVLLVTLLWIDLVVSLFIGNVVFTLSKTLIIILLISITFSLFATKFPDKSGRIIPFDEVKILLTSDKFRDTRNHFEKALKFFDDQPKPDNENCIKEAVCALEAYLETLTEKPASREFTKVISQLEGKEEGKIPPPIAEGMKKLYAYRGDGKAVAHAALQGSNVSDNEAELVLNLVATYITYLSGFYSEDKKTNEAEAKDLDSKLKEAFNS